LGRKGSGKTAVFKRILSLQKEEHNLFSVGHSFTEYPWDYHDLQVIPGAADQERYLNSWRYLILLSLAKILLNYDGARVWSDEAQEALIKIENFVVDTYGSRDPDITQIFHPGKRLRHLKSFKVNFDVLRIGVGATIDTEAVDMSQLPRLFQDVNKCVQELIFKCLNPDNRYFVCFDQLDLTFQPTDVGYKQRLIGLILAARDFANAARESGRFLKVLVFLRSDIYHKALLFEDKNKITDTYKIELEWDQAGGATLKSVMNRRFGELLEVPNDTAWDEVFDETLVMRGRQTKYQHILSRTFRRPRDVIRFCNSVLTVYRERRHTKGGLSKFLNEDVNFAHLDYSNYLRDEIVDEIYKYLPDYKIYFEILKSIEYQQFTTQEFASAFERWKDRFERVTPMDTVLENLYEFSIIGYYRAGGSGYGGAEYVYQYLDPRAEFNRSVERFRVHWGLVDSFGLKQYRVSENTEE
jgi:hypothetical protein